MMFFGAVCFVLVVAAVFGIANWFAETMMRDMDRWADQFRARLDAEARPRIDVNILVTSTKEKSK